ncbi:PDGLE domain-containing protein [bacterium]|nr:PDGLE domain-containing protein [bacterium]
MKRITIGLVILGVLALAAALASPLASGSPDGLEAALERAAGEGDGVEEGEQILGSPWPDYDVTGNETAGSTILAGVIGALITLAVGLGLAKLLSLKRA